MSKPFTAVSVNHVLVDNNPCREKCLLKKFVVTSDPVSTKADTGTPPIFLPLQLGNWPTALSKNLIVGWKGTVLS